MSTGKARDRVLTVEVEAGGALRDLRIEESALRLGPEELSRRILGLVDRAAAQASRRLDLDDADSLGLGTSAELAEAVEETTPDTWRVQ
ncbi:YbaB/EbfC family DNA-binding protein [Amycolatopsis pittospori]|uniref:YbaB/EbfC family DNA-binding protein n=1 Tax=Amycolatopsis pittospori TaxID=2749434 RepID=UPI0015F0E33B|nr:YbaB/EbfC family DNA-binding protein [Amycolatopsis pittospori]